MTVEVKSLAEITYEALSILCKHLGVANTMRFVNQFTTGYGNYTEERKELHCRVQFSKVGQAAIRICRDRLRQTPLNRSARKLAI